jgi:hypothetical protein
MKYCGAWREKALWRRKNRWWLRWYQRWKIWKLCKNTPPEIAIKVLCEMAMIELIVKMGYRQDKMWTSDEEEQLNILLNEAEILSNKIIKEIKR